ncbi:MAG: 23S rRNA (adenine(2503)-C(2))-methyltransferase RlmN, partial [Acidobacteriota bacterium]
GIAARRITVSTCGVTPGLERFQNLGLQVNLSVSFHAAGQELRSRLLPISRKYPLPELVRALASYVRKTGRRPTLEYILVDGVNDSSAEARRLAQVARQIRAKVNLIPLSPIFGLDFAPTPEAQQELFRKILEDRGVSVMLRRSKGADIQAACGQLAGKKKGDLKK